ncbi:MAG: glycosyltransferase family 2 protein [Armatimonadota bacterium]|nr:glycosyltransferase family 2 protein [Armatimonadota bacterium]
MASGTSAALKFDRPELQPQDSISVVIPAYNEADSLEPLYDELIRVLTETGLPFDIIFVDDGSYDDTHLVLKQIRERDSRVKELRMRRNFGKAAALSEGFKEAKGSVIFTMDADLQDDPSEIPNFLAKLNEGYDLVSGWKFHRLDPIGKTLPSKLFNKVAAMTTGVRLHDFNCGFKVYRREVLEHVSVYGELHRYIPALAFGNGFMVGEIKVNHRPRKFGKSKYGIARFTRGFLDLLTVLFITRYTKKPLHLFGSLGLMLLSAGFLINAYLAVIWLMGESIGRRPLLILGVLLMILGIQSISTGLLGEMIVHVQRKDDTCVASNTERNGQME